MLGDALLVLALAGDPGPVDFATIPRTIQRAPKFVSPRPLYGLFVFGERGETRVWTVLDQSDPKKGLYDILYLDRDADGVLGEEGERFEGSKPTESDPDESKKQVFEIGELAQPNSKLVHTDFKLTWTSERVSFRMLWRGQKLTMGGYGPTAKDYGKFAESPEQAPIIVPGWDFSFQFETWLGEKLALGNDTDFKVFVGNKGSVRGWFSCVDDKFLPKGEYALATLFYTDKGGKQQRWQAKLAERC